MDSSRTIAKCLILRTSEFEQRKQSVFLECLEGPPCIFYLGIILVPWKEGIERNGYHGLAFAGLRSYARLGSCTTIEFA